MERKQTKYYPTTKKYALNPNPKQFAKAITLLETLQRFHNKILVCQITLVAEGLEGHIDIEKLIKIMKKDYGSDFYGFVWSC
jgi:hypothetical protein